MNTTAHNKLVSFIWSLADDCLRDVYVRGKYRDVILPVVVLRRLDALLEHTKEKVLEELQFHIKEMETNIDSLDDEAWVDIDKTKIAYEISFNKYFYKHKELREISEVASEIMELEKQNEGLIAGILNLG
ncbi:MAG: type I restriction-modification system subunit M N-terminal domain-containing protein [Marinifilaceae bacterium]|jgi:type I restriction-modification system DNA methylase subunit|nr:type I restriction-modification system subunit M N-terminal domain-containing protein [Marinifilaceae bacterium]